MKYLRRYLSLLFALALFVGTFSTIAHAKEVKDFSIDISTKLYSPDTTYFSYSTTRGNSETFRIEHEEKRVALDYECFLQNQITFGMSDGSLIAKKGETFTVNIQNIGVGINANGNHYPLDANDELTVMLINTDGSYTYIYDGIEWSYSGGNETHSVSFSTTTNKDVRKIRFVEKIMQYDFTGLHGVYTSSLTLGSYDNPLALLVEVDSKESGLLKNIGDKLSNLWNAIIELPTKIWDKMKSGLQELFIPSDGFFEGLMDRLSNRVKEQGGIFTQVMELLNENWDSIIEADETDSIELPEATINFGDTPFTFGGYNVKIVPEGFEWLATICKTVTGIICTVAFVNGMRKKYEEFMGVEK